MNKAKIIQTLYNICDNLMTDNYNQFTYEHSRGFRKGHAEAIKDIENIMEDNHDEQRLGAYKRNSD